MKRLLLAALFVGGCMGGGGTTTEVDPLDGTQWSMPVSGVDCYYGTAFETGTYTTLLGCTLNDGTLAGQLEQGDYTLSGHQITTHALVSSCPADQVTIDQTSNFSMTQTNLTISNTSGVLVFTRVTPGGSGGGSLPFGCFDSQGVFTARAVMPL